jgi:hypothetical protein
MGSGLTQRAATVLNVKAVAVFFIQLGNIK